MDIFISMCLSSVLQILLFAFVPFVWWCVTARKEQGFAKWLGLKMPKFDKSLVSWIVGTCVVFILFSVFILNAIRGVESATSVFSGLGIRALPSILVYAIFNTAFPEEILFRGFVLKRFSNKFGFEVGNMVQAVLFGLLHGVMFVSLVSPIKAIGIILFTAGIAWVMGYINEKKADGSIVPSWIIHSVSNIFAGLCSAFLWI